MHDIGYRYIFNKIHRAVVSRLNVGTVRQKWKGPNSKECSSFGGKRKALVTNFALEDFELVFFTVQSAKNRGGNQEIPNGGRA